MTQFPGSTETRRDFPSQRPPSHSGERKRGQAALRGDALGSRSKPTRLCLRPAAFVWLAAITLSCRRLLVLPPQQEFSRIPALGAKPSSARGRNLTKTARNGCLLRAELRLLMPHSHLDKAGFVPVSDAPSWLRSGVRLRRVPTSAMSSAWMLSCCSPRLCWALP